MMELPETTTIGRQAKETLTGLTITEVYNATHLHKFTFFNGDPTLYRDLLVGKRVETAEGKGIFVDIRLGNDIFLSTFDGANMRYNSEKEDVPRKYQLLITFDNNAFVSFNTTMYGGIYAFRGNLDNKYRTLSLKSIAPLDNRFDESYFENLIASEQKNISAKALLATGQRIPGVGNGVLQDILFQAKIHPKRKIFSFTDPEKETLFQSLKTTLRSMTDGGGRDTENDLFGQKGTYKTILSKNTFGKPCPHCGGEIRKEAYMGGSVYYCPVCQKL